MGEAAETVDEAAEWWMRRRRRWIGPEQVAAAEVGHPEAEAVAANPSRSPPLIQPNLVDLL